MDPAEAAEAFKQSFVKEFGENGPQWITVGWQEATARAHGQYKFLFVYLHSHYHQVRVTTPCPALHRQADLLLISRVSRSAVKEVARLD